MVPELRASSSFALTAGRVLEREFPAELPTRSTRRLGGKGYQGRTVPRFADDYGTMPVVVEVLRAAARPLRVREIVDLAGERLPTRASTGQGRRSVVARDLVREIARGDRSRVRKVGVGLFEAVR